MDLDTCPTSRVPGDSDLPVSPQPRRAVGVGRLPHRLVGLELGADLAGYVTTSGSPVTAYGHVGAAAVQGVPYASGAYRYLTLRVNDDRPGNGKGSFTCTVQRWRLS